MPSGSASARSRACRRTRMELFVARRGDGYDSGARRLAALRPRCRRDRKTGSGDAFRSIGPRPPCRALAGPRARPQGAAEAMPLFDRRRHPLRDNEPETKLPVMPLGRACHPRLPLARPVPQGASASPSCAQRLDRSAVTPNDAPAPRAGQQARLGRRARPRAAASRQGQCRSS